MTFTLNQFFSIVILIVRNKNHFWALDTAHWTLWIYDVTHRLNLHLNTEKIVQQFLDHKIILFK